MSSLGFFDSSKDKKAHALWDVVCRNRGREILVPITLKLQRKSGWTFALLAAQCI